MQKSKLQLKSQNLTLILAAGDASEGSQAKMYRRLGNARGRTRELKFIFAFFLFISSFFLFLPPVNAQYIRYPVKELGNCQNARECYLYCQIPENTPLCWSYNKYVVKTNVLGETAAPALTYPIAELGNCATAEGCFIYCSQPQNQTACFSYARNKGLIKEEAKQEGEEEPRPEVIAAAKTELGCDSKEACGAICSQPANHEKCFAFAQKYGLHRGPPPGEGRPAPPPDIMAKAQAELGCASQESCMQLCQNPDNTQKCMDFGRKHKLMREEEIENFEEHKEKFEKYREKKEQMMQEAKKELGCDSYEGCGSFCSREENREKCMSLGRKHGMIQNTQGNVTRPGGCTSDSECKEYCEKHPSDCPGFTKESRENSQQTRQETQNGTAQRKPESQPKEGAFLGPKGCTTERECQVYCKEHPDECPGFPKEKFLPSSSNSSGKSSNAPATPYPSFRPPETNYQPTPYQYNSSGTNTNFPTSPPIP